LKSINNREGRMRRGYQGENLYVVISAYQEDW
jgi:hypothetical protein